MISTSNDCSLVSHTLIQYGSVPLEIAALVGHTKTVQRLLEAGANINHQNKVMTVPGWKGSRSHACLREITALLRVKNA